MASAEEDFLEMFPVWAGFCVGLLGLWLFYKYWTRTFNFFKRLGIPHERPLPILGNSHRELKMGAKAYDQMAISKFGKIYGYFHGLTPRLVVGDLEKVKLIFVKNFDAFSNRPRGNNQVRSLTLLDLLDDHWKRVRNTITPAFSSGKLKLMTWKINRCVDSLLDQLSASDKIGDNIDIMKATGNFTMDTIASIAFGITLNSTKEHGQFVHLAKEMLTNNFNMQQPLLLLDTFFPILGKIARYLGFRRIPQTGLDFFLEIVGAAMQKRLDESYDSIDLMQLMANAHLMQDDESNSVSNGEAGKASGRKSETRGLSKDEILAQGIVFFLAGYETTASALGFACYNLTMNQECQERVRQEVVNAVDSKSDDVSYDDLQNLPYTKQVLEETLRLQTVASRTARLTSRDIDVDGLFIPAGTWVTCPIAAIHHDPDIYPEPSKFDPDRFLPEEKAKRHPCSYLPFGLGPRNCIGMRLALVEAQISLARIVRNFKLEPCEETEVNLEFKPNALLLKPKRTIKLKVTKLDV